MTKKKQKGTLALDAMGNDAGPSEMVNAVHMSLQQFKTLGKIILVGDKDILSPLILEKGLKDNPRLELRHASEVIGMDEKPIQSIKQKKDSSLVRAIELVKEGDADCILSCGNTGSLMAAATIKLRPATGIERPSLGVIIPCKDHNFTMIDVGANPSAEPKNLVHNAILGNHYCKIALNCKKPRVGLLSIGTEEGKGNELIGETHNLLKEMGGLINYQGLIEGFQVFENHVDVVVCDGFVGNIVLKTSESLFHLLKSFLKEELMKTPMRKLGAFLCKDAFAEMKKQLDPDTHAGAPLLGLNGLVIKTHASSSSKAISGAIGIATNMMDCNMNEEIKIDIEQANKIVSDINNIEEPKKSPALN